MNTTDENRALSAPGLFGGFRFHAFHFNWLWRDEFICVFGVAGGRVNGSPDARWLYSLRVFLGFCKIEVLWWSGPPNA